MVITIIMMTNPTARLPLLLLLLLPGDVCVHVCLFTGTERLHSILVAACV